MPMCKNQNYRVKRILKGWGDGSMLATEEDLSFNPQHPCKKLRMAALVETVG